MNRRKALILSIPGFVIVFIVVVAVMALMFNATPPSATEEAAASDAIQEQMAPPAVLSPEAGVPAAAEGSAPKVIYENQ